jgi:hypothetical protein
MPVSKHEKFKLGHYPIFDLILLESIEIDGLLAPAFCSNSYQRANEVTRTHWRTRLCLGPTEETSFHLAGWEYVMALTS